MGCFVLVDCGVLGCRFSYCSDGGFRLSFAVGNAPNDQAICGIAYTMVADDQGRVHSGWHHRRDNLQCGVGGHVVSAIKNMMDVLANVGVIVTIVVITVAVVKVLSSGVTQKYRDKEK